MIGYLLLKVTGVKYVVTNRAVKRVQAMGYRLLDETPLANIAQVTVDPDSRLAFYRTGDVRLTNAAGDTLQLLRRRAVSRSVRSGDSGSPRRPQVHRGGVDDDPRP